MHEQEREQLRELATYLVGPAEIATMLDVEANTVNVWKRRYTDFPQPVARLRLGDIWDSRDICDWAARTGRQCQRAPTAADLRDDGAELADKPTFGPHQSSGR
jgi:hypothetical protein